MSFLISDFVSGKDAGHNLNFSDEGWNPGEKSRERVTDKISA